MTATATTPTNAVRPRWSSHGDTPHPVATEQDMALRIARLAMPGSWATVTRPGGAYEVRRVPGGWVVEREGASQRFRRGAEAAHALWEWRV